MHGRIATLDGERQLIAGVNADDALHVGEAADGLAIDHGHDVANLKARGRSRAIGFDFVDARGRVYGATSFDTPAVVVHRLRLAERRTLATTVGAGPEYVLVLAAVAALLAAAWPRRTTRRFAGRVATKEET